MMQDWLMCKTGC